MSKVKNTKEQNWGLTEERRRKNKRQYRLLTHNDTKSNMVYCTLDKLSPQIFSPKVQVHLGQSFVFFVFQSSELFTFFSQFQIIFRGRSIIKFQFCHCPGRCRCLSRCRSWSCRCRHLVASSLAALLVRRRFRSRRSRSMLPLGHRLAVVVWCHRQSCCMSGHAACVGCSGRGRKCESTQSPSRLSGSASGILDPVYVAVLHVFDARAVDDSCPHSYVRYSSFMWSSSYS